MFQYLKFTFSLFLLVLFCSGAARAQSPHAAPAHGHQHATQPPAPSGPSPYDPYKVLIGEWNVSQEGQAPAFLFRFTWGPKESYIWSAVSLLENGKEYPHFEGMLVWNSVNKNLDMLFAVGLDGPDSLERGTVSIDSNGIIVREITLVNEKGTGHFRQTFHAEGPDKILTSVMRETKDGWVASLPGSDHLVMTRRESHHHN